MSIKKALQGKKRFNRRYLYDIALDEGVGAHLVSWITGLMVFFVTLALTINLGLNALTQNWVSGLAGSLTVELQPPLPSAQDKITPVEQAEFDTQIQKILSTARANPGVADARALSRDEIQALVRPWLGSRLAGDLPLPALIDIKIAREADTAKLQAEIKAAAPAATIDTHDDTLDDVRTLVGTARLFVLLLTGVIVLLAAAAISSIVRAKLAIHAGEVETLHLIGASDEYIARQFRRHTLEGTLKGALAGLACMVVTLLGIGYLTHAIDSALLPRLKLPAAEWAVLFATPVLFGSLIAHLTAQKTVMRELVKLP
jgi:cell division transport system permease protein